jgi:hypothetical protein
VDVEVELRAEPGGEGAALVPRVLPVGYEPVTQRA